MTTYKEAGVDIDAGTEAISRIKKHVRSTFNENVLTDLGGFGGCFQFQKDKYKEPVLVSSSDGVGTKLKLAFITNRHDTIGQCLDLDVNDSILVAAVNYNGFIIYDLFDSSGNIFPKQKYHGLDLDPNIASNQINKVIISSI